MPLSMSGLVDPRRWRKFSILWAAIVSVAWSALAPAHADQIVPSDRVVTRVIVREAPNGAAARIGALAPGQSLPLVSELRGYYRVRLPDGREGYVSRAWTDRVLSDAIESAPLHADVADYVVHVVDVGTGLAVVVRGRDFTLIYDGGSNDDIATGADNRLTAYLAHVLPDVTEIDALILSHPHRDHVELLEDVLLQYDVRSVWDSGRFYANCGYRRFLAAVEREPGVAYRSATAGAGSHRVRFDANSCRGQPARTIEIPRSAPIDGDRHALGEGAWMTVLYADAAPHRDPNRNSLVVRLDLGERRVLLMGDADGGSRRNFHLPAPRPGTIEAWLLENAPGQLQADVLVVGHHGSRTSSRSDFLDRVDASIFAISSGPFGYGSAIPRTVLPDEEVELALQARGQVLQTDNDDAACRINPRKIGPDNDGRPGGCDNIQITIHGQELAATIYRGYER
jgi:beta-lactamase superfamily II metal-dependent hydrolase